VLAAPLKGDEQPIGPAPSTTHVPNAEAYVGTYRNDARSVVVEPDGDGLALVHGDRRARLETVRDADDLFLVDDALLDRWPLRFGRDEGGVVVEAFLGDDWLVNERWRGPAPRTHPPAWEAFPGLYRRANAWSPTLRVALRKGRLVLEWNDDFEEVSEELVPLEDDWFHVGLQAWKPQWARFDDVVEGRATRVTFNGGTWYRSFED
jgi:hypothetical protein